MGTLAAAPELKLDGIGAPQTAGQGGRIHQVRTRQVHQVDPTKHSIDQPGGQAAPDRNNRRQPGVQCNELVT